MKKFNCRSHWCNSPSESRSKDPSTEKGYILLIMMMMATLLLISLTAAVPSIYVEGQREKEKELIFRGEQYARAIELFHMQFHRYPTSVKELLHTNNMSFLRQAYRDPMAKNGKWRFIHATGTGIILDSKILGPPGKQKGLPGGTSSSGQPSSTGVQGGTGSQSTQSNSQQNGSQVGSFSLFGSGPGSSQPQQGSGSTTSLFGKNKLVGAYIVGVASTSHQRSIGVFDHRTEYDEWEFLGVPGAPGAPNLTGTSLVPGAAVQPGQPSSGPGSQPNSGGGFHLGPSQPSQPGSIFGGNSNPRP